VQLVDIFKGENFYLKDICSLQCIFQRKFQVMKLIFNVCFGQWFMTVFNEPLKIKVQSKIHLKFHAKIWLVLFITLREEQHTCAKVMTYGFDLSYNSWFCQHFWHHILTLSSIFLPVTNKRMQAMFKWLYVTLEQDG
jgi:hypothetical protein